MPVPRRRRMVGTSLKMYFDVSTTLSYVQSVADLDRYAQSLDVDMFVLPDFVTLMNCQQILSSTSVALGAQDTFWEDSGPYTGEVSPVTLKQAGVKIVEVGHAERRGLFAESNDQVAKKAAAAVRNGIIPLICVGEKTRGSNIASAAVGAAVEECRPQVMSAMNAVPNDAEVIIAYEPVWAIGADQPAATDHVVAVTRELRRMTEWRQGPVKILYGGSAGPGLFAKLNGAVDGLFLGRFGHNIENLRQVIKEVSEA